jgi:hypothetical protein
MPSKEVVTFWLDMTAPMTLLSRIPGELRSVQSATLRQRPSFRLSFAVMTANTLAERLQIRPGASVWFSPVEWLWMLGPLPPGVHATGELAGATVAITFGSNAASVRWFLDRYRTILSTVPVMWVCYQTRGRSDFNRASLVTMLAAHGQHPVAEVAFDAGWTAMRIRPTGAPPVPR